MTEQLQLRRGTAVQVAAFTGAQGEVVVDTTNNRVVVHDGSTAGGFPHVRQSDAATLATLGIGTASDPTNPLSVTANNVLFNELSTGSGGTGDIRVKLNKATSGNTASFLYQDGFSGRAEIGLTGDDNFHFKVSADGSTWHDGIIISASTGAVTIALLTLTGPVQAMSYTVGTLPAAGTAGRIAYASNLRVFNGAGVQQGAGSGTGGLVVDNGTHWVNADAQSVTAVA
jgi:hypothetical protein